MTYFLSMLIIRWCWATVMKVMTVTSRLIRKSIRVVGSSKAGPCVCLACRMCFSAKSRLVFFFFCFFFFHTRRWQAASSPIPLYSSTAWVSRVIAFLCQHPTLTISSYWAVRGATGLAWNQVWFPHWQPASCLLGEKWGFFPANKAQEKPCSVCVIRTKRNKKICIVTILQRQPNAGLSNHKLMHEEMFCSVTIKETWHRSLILQSDK